MRKVLRGYAAAANHPDFDAATGGRGGDLTEHRSDGCSGNEGTGDTEEFLSRHDDEGLMDPVEKGAEVVIANSLILRWTPMMNRASKPAKSSRRPRAKTASLDISAVFYGWFRLGLPLSVGSVWSVPTATLVSAWQAAIDQGIVPAPAPEAELSLTEEVKRLKRVYARKRRKPGPTAPAQLRDLLATLPVQLRLAQTRLPAAEVARLRTDDPKLLEQLEQFAPFQGHAVAVARTLRLATLTGSHLPLVAALQLRLVKMKESVGSLRPLTALQHKDWIKLIHTHGVPDGVTLTPAAYAEALAERLESLYPSEALRRHFLQQRRLARLPALREIALWVNENPSIDLLSGDPETLLRTAAPRRRSKQRTEELVAGLRSLQRIILITPRFEEMRVLLADNLQSAAQLLAVGVHQLARRLKGKLPRERVTYLCRRAAFVLVGSTPSQIQKST